TRRTSTARSTRFGRTTRSAETTAPQRAACVRRNVARPRRRPPGAPAPRSSPHRAPEVPSANPADLTATLHPHTARCTPEGRTPHVRRLVRNSLVCDYCPGRLWPQPHARRKELPITSFAGGEKRGPNTPIAKRRPDRRTRGRRSPAASPVATPRVATSLGR